MQFSQTKNEIVSYNTMDLVENIIINNNWEYEKDTNDSLHVEIGGYNCDYQLSFGVSNELRLLQISCAYDIRIPDDKLEKIYSLLAKVNETLLIGHFEVWEKDRWPMFRHTLPIPKDKLICTHQIQDISLFSIEECDRYYPAFQYVAWGGKSVKEAIAYSLLTTRGEA